MKVIIIIIISGKIVNLNNIIEKFSQSSMHTKIVTNLSEAKTLFRYDNLDQLKFEVLLREKIIEAATELAKSGINFKTFEKSTCNEEYWTRTERGGFKIKEGGSPYDGINDIFINGSKYGTECSTAIVIIYYKALTKILSKEIFDSTFADLELYSWRDIDSDLDVKAKLIKDDFIPGDCRYFKNPDYNPEKAEWQGENVIDMGNGTYYGHGIGTKTANQMIEILNKYRKADATQSAYLTDTVANPNYKHLSSLK